MRRHSTSSYVLEKSSEWKWARNDENLGLLLETVNVLRIATTPFHKQFMIEEAVVVKKRTPEADLISELTAFAGLKPKLDHVTKITKRLQKRHNA